MVLVKLYPGYLVHIQVVGCDRIPSAKQIQPIDVEFVDRLFVLPHAASCRYLDSRQFLQQILQHPVPGILEGAHLIDHGVAFLNDWRSRHGGLPEHKLLCFELDGHCGRLRSNFDRFVAHHRHHDCVWHAPTLKLEPAILIRHCVLSQNPVEIGHDESSGYWFARVLVNHDSPDACLSGTNKSKGNGDGHCQE